MKFPRISHLTGLYLITGVCGLIDAACFLSLGGVFAEIILMLVVFAAGAVIGGRLVRGRWQETRHGFTAEGILLLLAFLATVALDPGQSGPARDVVVSLLAFAMGLQNALLRRHGVPDLATNVMTLTMTALIAESRIAGGGNDRWQRRSGSVLIFLVSATVGAALTTWLGPWAPLGLSVAMFRLALAGIDPRSSARH